MIRARTSVECWRTSFGGSEDMGTMLAPHPTRGRDFLAVDRKHYLLEKLKVVESSMSHKDISRNFLLQCSEAISGQIEGHERPATAARPT